ncbi:MAG: alkaline phosphatase family protein [Pseudomonadota bacterium]
MSANLIHDLTPTKPDYEGASIVNLMRSIGDALGAPTNGYEPLHQLDAAYLHERRVIMLVIDGLGVELLKHLSPDGPFTSALVGEMTSVYPPTTAAAITTLLSGVAPQQHALAGWFVRFPEIDTVSAVLPFVPRGPGIMPRRIDELLDTPSFFAKIARDSAMLQPQALAHSEFSRLLGANAARLGYADLDDLCTQLTQIICGRPNFSYTYAYWPMLDTLAHRFGPASREVADHFHALETAIGELVEQVEGSGTTLLITADHGFIESGEDERVDISQHPELAACLREPLSGEPRSAYCVFENNQIEQGVQYLEDVLADKITAMPSGDLIDQQWFGLGQPHPALRERLGDFTLQMKGRYTVRDLVPGERDMQFAGMHGGLTRAEQMVPLIVAA